MRSAGFTINGSLPRRLPTKNKFVAASLISHVQHEPCFFPLRCSALQVTFFACLSATEAEQERLEEDD